MDYGATYLVFLDFTIFTFANHDRNDFNSCEPLCIICVRAGTGYAVTLSIMFPRMDNKIDPNVDPSVALQSIFGQVDLNFLI